MNRLFILFFLLFWSIWSFAQKTNHTIKISEKDLGITLQTAIKKFHVDTSKCGMLDEPPGVAHGIQAEMKNRIVIYLHIHRKEFKSFVYSLQDILNERIIGIGLAYPNCKTKTIGKGLVWWPNPYCKDINLNNKYQPQK